MIFLRPRFQDLRAVLAVCLLLSLGGCARPALEGAWQAMRPAAGPEILGDALAIETLRQAFARNRKALAAADPDAPMRFGERVIRRADYLAALDFLQDGLAAPENFVALVRENFDFFEAYGRDSWGEVLVTGYHEPLLAASRRPLPGLDQPLYRPPADLALPYHDRATIDGKAVLAGKDLELAWVDPVDAFFLHIQGSGLLDFADGSRMRLGYAAQNGARYEAIGRFLTDVIPLEKMSMQRIRAHLATLDRLQLQEILNKNPSYVFFGELGGEALTSMGAEVTAGRSIATDTRYFPKGALAFLDIELPVFNDPGAQEEDGWAPAPRFVFDQDAGGAIKGGGRVDLFMGSDALAAAQAGVMRRRGRLWYLVPKDGFLQGLAISTSKHSSKAGGSF